MNLNFKTTKETSKKKSYYLNTKKYDLKNKNRNDMKKLQKFKIKNLTDGEDIKNSNSFELKIEEYQAKPKIIIPPIITNQINKNINLQNKNNNLYTSLFNDNQEEKIINNSSNLKSFFNQKNEISFRSNNCVENSSKKTTMRSGAKSMNKYIKYLETIEDNINLKNNDISKNEEIQLKCYLKDIPSFFNKDNSKKNIYFGMNKKTLFHNNILFTEFK